MRWTWVLTRHYILSKCDWEGEGLNNNNVLGILEDFFLSEVGDENCGIGSRGDFQVGRDYLYDSCCESRIIEGAEGIPEMTVE